MRIIAMVSLFSLTWVASAGAADTLPLFGAADAPSPDLFRELLRFTGRLHPMVVHFPVALLVCAGMLEILALRVPSTRFAARVCLYIGAASAIAAAGMGWLIAAHEPHSRAELQILEAHRWTGIATAVFAVIAAALAAIDARRTRPMLAAAYRYALFSAVLVVSFAGHMGGALVYGEDYALRAFSAWREASKKPTPIITPPPVQQVQQVQQVDGPQIGDPPVEDPQANDPGVTESALPVPVDFASQIRPIFEVHCYECHGPDEQEGDLALDKRSGLFHEEPEFWSVIPGKPDESLLVEMIEYPPDDPEFMPAEGDPLPADQIALIRRWIREGAVWPPDPGPD